MYSKRTGGCFLVHSSLISSSTKNVCSKRLEGYFIVYCMKNVCSKWVFLVYSELMSIIHLKWFTTNFIKLPWTDGFFKLLPFSSFSKLCKTLASGCFLVYSSNFIKPPGMAVFSLLISLTRFPLTDAFDLKSLLSGLCMSLWPNGVGKQLLTNVFIM